MSLGDRLRDARHKKGWSLRALGERTGFSASFLSQVELGQSSPSLASLEKIAGALDLSLSRVITEEAEPSALLRKAQRGGIRSEWSKAYVESLVPVGWDEQFEALLLRIEAGGRTGERRVGAGSKLFAYITSGRARLTLSQPVEELVLEQGDSVAIDGPRGACWETHDDETSEIVVVTARMGR